MGYSYDTPMGITRVDQAETAEPLDPQTAGLVQRLKRIEGQVRGLQQMLVESRDCSDVLTQLSAARKALDHVGFLMVAERLSQCMARPGGTTEDGHDLDDVRRMFLRLS